MPSLLAILHSEPKGGDKMAALKTSRLPNFVPCPNTSTDQPEAPEEQSYACRTAAEFLSFRFLRHFVSALELPGMLQAYMLSLHRVLDWQPSDTHQDLVYL